MNLHTPRLELMNWTLPLCQAIVEGPKAMQTHLGLRVPDNYSEFPDVMKMFAGKLQEDLSQVHWWSYLVIHTQDQTVIGTCGFKGPPGRDGIAEIGYEIHPDYRKQGLATEAATALRDYALSQPGILGLMAHTISADNESTNVLKKSE